MANVTQRLSLSNPVNGTNSKLYLLVLAIRKWHKNVSGRCWYYSDGNIIFVEVTSDGCGGGTLAWKNNRWRSNIFYNFLLCLLRD